MYTTVMDRWLKHVRDYIRFLLRKNEFRDIDDRFYEKIKNKKFSSMKG